MSWYKQTWPIAEPLYHSILKMPFITELTTGTLPPEKFRFYIAQDSIYLEYFGRVLALIAARVRSPEASLAFIRFSEGAIAAENALHHSYFKEFGIRERGEAEPACHHYIHFLRSMASSECVELGMASVLPCFVIYQKTGDHIYGMQKNPENPYKRWIDMYAGEAFAQSVERAIALCDQAAAAASPAVRAEMTEVFLKATQLEYDFWNGAYNLRKWFVPEG